jgi:putative thiamine transport system permease protein
LTIALFLGPVVCGLAGTVWPALAAGPWRELWQQPGLTRGVLLTLGSGLGATLLALLAALLIAASAGERLAVGRRRFLLPLLLAVPHLASAVGTAFLLAPSGWLARLASPWLTGWSRPPDLLTVNDPWGLALTAGLALRETPFLLLAIAAAQAQLASGRLLAVARSTGHGRREAWLRLVLPLIYRQLRLPLYAVLAFSLSVVDMALVLGPATPPVLAVQVLRWLTDPDATWHPIGAAGALLQLGLIVAALALWRLAEAAVAGLARPWLAGGPQPRLDRLLALGGRIAEATVFGLGLAGLAVVILWSLTGAWRFPAGLPQLWSLASWRWGLGGLALPAANTLLLGATTALLALVAVLACLEHEARAGRRPEARVLWLAYLPLLLPQIGFLFGLQVLLVRLGLDASLAGLAWSHLIFVLPYTLLMLREPYLALHPRWLATSRTLGRSPGYVFWRVRLPLLRRPILVALAVGFSVSVAQYLPTLFVGAGRYPTLVTETLALASGGDRRLAAVAALLLAALPLLALAAALAVPSARLGHREPD